MSKGITGINKPFKMGKSQHQAITFIGLLMAIAAVLGGLAVPLSNNFLPRPSIQIQSDDPGFSGVSKIMQASCLDCHSAGLNSGLTAKPIYFDWPVAKDIIARDMIRARGVFVLSREQLSGAQPIASVALAKIASTIQDGSMPPKNYTFMHWNAALSREQKQSILSYIQEKQEDSNVALSAVLQPNPFHPEPKKAALGQKLFNDKRLSADNSVSCAGCHSSTRGGCDQVAFSNGIKGHKCPINTPTVFNCAFNFRQFWDGRAKDLSDQVGQSITDPNQMGSNFTEVLAKLKNDTVYSAMSKAGYGGALTAGTIKDAIATYEKTLLTPGAPFDHYLKGDNTALSEQEKRGYQLFMEKGCASCHSGVALGGLSFEKLGVAQNYYDSRQMTLKRPVSDADNGRFNVTKNPLDKGKFKVPTLRNIAITAPYLHDGSIKDLPEVVSTMALYQTGTAISPDENAAIVSFLKTLTGRLPDKKLQ